MESIKVEKTNLTENIADRLARWAQNPAEDRIKYLTVKLGLETLLINLSRLLVVYTVVLFIGLFFQVLVFNVSYYLIRRVAGGMHAPNNLLCSLLSVIAFIGIPYLGIL